ncbi:MAG: RsmE family RNA methyltransferase [Anaerolineae bacterium]
MHLHRFFIPPEWLQGEGVEITGPLTHQMRNVLRLKPGDRVILLDNSGWEYQVELGEVSRERVAGQILQKSLVASEPRTKITLYQSVLRGRAFESVLQKCTEVGVVAFVPVVAARCIISSLEDIRENKLERWRRITLEAAEQSRRGRLPVLRPALLLRQAWQEASGGGLTIVPWEEAGPGMPAQRNKSLRSLLRGAEPTPFSVNLFIGPEGGFTPQEIEQGERYGAVPVTLGPRILRAETAGLVAASVILCELGDMG